MSSRARIGLLAAALAVIVVAFVLLSPGGDDEPTTASTATAPATVPDERATTSPATTPATGETPSTGEPAPPPAPAFATIRVAGGKPAGGVKTITLKKGDRARIEVSSRDTTSEVHLHGYDLTRDLRAGGRVRYSFDANAEGIFEIELEDTGVQIGRLVVEP